MPISIPRLEFTPPKQTITRSSLHFLTRLLLTYTVKMHITKTRLVMFWILARWMLQHSTISRILDSAFNAILALFPLVPVSLLMNVSK